MTNKHTNTGLYNYIYIYSVYTPCRPVSREGEREKERERGREREGERETEMCVPVWE